MQEGIAHVCLVLSTMTIVRAKIEVNIPRKRRGNCTQHDKVYYTQIGKKPIGKKCLEHWF